MPNRKKVVATGASGLITGLMLSAPRERYEEMTYSIGYIEALLAALAA